MIGATGQVGHALIHPLHTAGHDVSVLVRRTTPGRFPAGVRVVVEPEFTGTTFARLLPEADCVIYGVGLPEQFTLDETVFERVNRGLLNTFLAAMDASRVRRLVYVSTYEVFAPRDGVIRESHPVASLDGLTPYFRSMTQAYGDVVSFAERTGTDLTTIHPGALYGGLNTGDGFTNVIENLLNRRMWRLPVVPPGRFPLVHADSLAAGIVRSLDHTGAFILSDGMTDLHTLAQALRRHARSWVPPQVPAGFVHVATTGIELAARALRRRPILSKVQLAFMAAGNEPLAEKASQTWGFAPWPLDGGIQRYLADRERLLAVSRGR